MRNERYGEIDTMFVLLFDIIFVRWPKQKEPKIAPTWNKNDPGSHRGWRIYCHHGSGGASTPSGKLNMLIKHMNAIEADIYMMGHVHAQKGERLVQLGADRDCNKIVEKERIGVICGSYLKSYQHGVTSYSEMKGYSPTALGAARIIIKPETREMKAEV